jgi:hypothetical protein
MLPAPAWKKPRLVIERRRHRRYPIKIRVEYSLPDRHGLAVTCDICSGGVYIDTPDLLPVGKRIQLSLDWPAELDGRHALRLIITGKVLRCSQQGAAVSILRYEYRLRPKGITPFAKVG